MTYCKVRGDLDEQSMPLSWGNVGFAIPMKNVSENSARSVVRNDSAETP
jgi:hypothetical protein